MTLAGLTDTLRTFEKRLFFQPEQAMQKVRFTLWMDEDVLKAAKVRAGESGSTPSRVIAEAARMILIDNPQNEQERVLAAVEKVFNLIQRMDRRRGYDQQVLKEMVGLLVQSFFNHTPAVPDKDKKAALHSGKARFNRFLDTLATNLRGGQSILNDLPAAGEPLPAQIAAPKSPETVESSSSPDGNLPTVARPTKAVEPKPVAETATPEALSPAKADDGKPARWNLFGWKDTKNDTPE